jgi:hypothetical protein
MTGVMRRFRIRNRTHAETLGDPTHPLILPRKGEVAGSCQTEGEVRDNRCSVSSPSVAFGATSPWRGRIQPASAGETGYGRARQDGERRSFGGVN